MYQIVTAPDGSNVIVLEQDGVRLSFTENPENTDYQRYLDWLAAGNEPEIIEG